MYSKSGLRYPTISALITLAILIFALCVINTALYPIMAVICLVTTFITAVLYFTDHNIIGLVWLINTFIWVTTVMRLY